jgi:SNF2 family DNA or RNA helicase
MDEALKVAYEKLKEIRGRKDLALKPNKYLKDTFTGFDGQEYPFKLRYYQVQGVLHMVVMNRFLLGDDTGTGKTAMAISSYAYVLDKEPNTKAVVLTNKSVVGQWALEFEKFTKPGMIRVIQVSGTPKKREAAYEEFKNSQGPTVMIMGYATARQDVKQLQTIKDYILITDEASAYKNPSSQIHQVVRFMANQQAKRVWALTATLIKNNLVEGYGIYSVLCPGLFPPTKNAFINSYSITRMQKIAGSNRQVPVIVGYRKDHIENFRNKIDPFFLSRSKMDVASELPVLTIREDKVALTPEQQTKYQEALDGLLEIDTTGEQKETTKLTSLIYCQQIVDHPDLIDCEGDSYKMDHLFDILTEGDLAGEKVIVFSRFRKMIDLLEKEAKKKKITSVRITGAETKEEVRKEAMQKFQDPNSDIQVCFITTAAAEGINLQAAKAIIFFDSPWSAGDYLQILGRMIRIGSQHDRCYAIHLVASGTIDEDVIVTLKKKMKLVEKIMGKRLKGEKDQDAVIEAENDISDLFDSVRANARTRKYK